MDIKQYTSAKCGLEQGHYMDQGLGHRVFRGKDKDTESSYYSFFVFCGYLHLVGVTLSCFFLSFNCCGWCKKSLG